MHSTQCPEPDQAGQNLMLNSPELAEALRPRISALNYLGESAKLRRRLEDAEMRANDLQKALSTVRHENDVLRMMLGLPYLDWGPLPTPYPDSNIARMLGEFSKVDQSKADTHALYFLRPRRAAPLRLESCRNFGGVVR